MVLDVHLYAQKIFWTLLHFTYHPFQFQQYFFHSHLSPKLCSELIRTKYFRVPLNNSISSAASSRRSEIQSGFPSCTDLRVGICLRILALSLNRNTKSSSVIARPHVLLGKCKTSYRFLDNYLCLMARKSLPPPYPHH